MGPESDSARSGARTKERLVAAAREMFAREGYRGATVRAITDAVGVNVSAVAYHFDSKERLYHEVLRDVLLPLRERVLEACQRPGEPRERLEGVIHAVFEHLLENPDQPRFMVGIRMEEDRFPPVVQKILGPVIQALLRLMGEAQAASVVREAPPMLLVLSLLSQPVYFGIVLQRAPRDLIPVDPTTPAGRDRLLRHMVAFALTGLSPDPAPAPTDPPGTKEDQA